MTAEDGHSQAFAVLHLVSFDICILNRNLSQRANSVSMLGERAL
jgi:hypothetical protein